MPPVKMSVVPLRSFPRLYHFLCCIHPRSRAKLSYGVGRGWGPEHCGYRNSGGWDATSDVGCLCDRLLPGPSVPEPALSCSVEWMEPRYSSWETNCYILLVKLTMAATGSTRSHHLGSWCSLMGPFPGPDCWRFSTQPPHILMMPPLAHSDTIWLWL